MWPPSGRARSPCHPTCNREPLGDTGPTPSAAHAGPRPGEDSLGRGPGVPSGSGPPVLGRGAFGARGSLTCKQFETFGMLFGKLNGLHATSPRPLRAGIPRSLLTAQRVGEPQTGPTGAALPTWPRGFQGTRPPQARSQDDKATGTESRYRTPGGGLRGTEEPSGDGPACPQLTCWL